VSKDADDGFRDYAEEALHGKHLYMDQASPLEQPSDSPIYIPIKQFAVG